jgi:IS5 family transposase
MRPPRVIPTCGMCQTRKGKQWYFGMKAHIGVDSATKVIHSLVATAANVAECTILPDLLHGNETRVWGDQAYRGQREAIRQVAPAAQDSPVAAASIVVSSMRPRPSSPEAILAQPLWVATRRTQSRISHLHDLHDPHGVLNVRAK